jgi:hypothetical protein
MGNTVRLHNKLGIMPSSWVALLMMELLATQSIVAGLAWSAPLGPWAHVPKDALVSVVAIACQTITKQVEGFVKNVLAPTSFLSYSVLS